MSFQKKTTLRDTNQHVLSIVGSELTEYRFLRKPVLDLVQHSNNSTVPLFPPDINDSMILCLWILIRNIIHKLCFSSCRLNNSITKLDSGHVYTCRGFLSWCTFYVRSICYHVMKWAIPVWTIRHYTACICSNTNCAHGTQYKQTRPVLCCYRHYFEAACALLTTLQFACSSTGCLHCNSILVCIDTTCCTALKPPPSPRGGFTTGNRNWYNTVANSGGGATLRVFLRLSWYRYN